MRLNKYISHNSKYSRREADELIKSKRVKIGLRVVNDLSLSVKEGDKVYIDSVLIKRKFLFSVIIYHKKKGELVSKSDKFERSTIYDTLPYKFRHFMPVGRLDFGSEGLLILSDSPKVIDKLANSSLERIYDVRIDGSITEDIKKGMQEGVKIKGSKAGAHRLSKITDMNIEPFLWHKMIKDAKKYSRIRVAIKSGQNRELRRFFAYFNREILDLKRIEYGGISLGMLKMGKSRYLSSSEYNSLHEFLKSGDKK